jgi:hypothetical protein
MESLLKISLSIGVNLRPCKSTNLIAYGYKSGALWVLFKNNNLYKYPNISKEQYVSLDRCQSKGIWVSKNLVQSKVPCEKYKI